MLRRRPWASCWPPSASIRRRGVSPSPSTVRSCRGGDGRTCRSRRPTISRSSARAREVEMAVLQADPLVIAGRGFASRLFLGSAGYPNQQIMLDALAASGTELVTLSIRRISLDGYGESMIDVLGGRYHLLPNTAGCATARDAILTARLAREALATNWIKLEIIGDRETLHPDVEQLLEATETLTRDGFVVLPYCNDDPVACRKLAMSGAAAIMPLRSPIGSGIGVCNPY